MLIFDTFVLQFLYEYKRYKQKNGCCDNQRRLRIAKKECRSVSKQSLLYILKGLEQDEEKRD